MIRFLNLLFFSLLILGCTPSGVVSGESGSSLTAEKESSIIFINSSKLVGVWSLKSLLGLEDEYAKTEQYFADRGEALIWKPVVSDVIKLSYKVYPLRRQTWVSVHGSNSHTSVYNGNLKNGFESLTLSETIPSTLRYSTSMVRQSSGEIEPTGPAPVEVATTHYFKVQADVVRIEVSDDGQTLKHFDKENKVIALFERVEAAE